MNPGFVLVWPGDLEQEKGVDMIDGILHDQFNLGIGDPGITSLTRAGRTGPPAMDVLNRPVAERQRHDCFRFPGKLLAIEIHLHDRGAYQTLWNPCWRGVAGFTEAKISTLIESLECVAGLLEGTISKHIVSDEAGAFTQLPS